MTKKVVIIIIMGILIFTTIGYFIILQTNIVNTESLIKISDRSCETDQGCILAATGCGCGCPDYSINVKFKAKYESLYKVICIYRNLPCGMPCIPNKAICKNDLCTVETVFN